MTEAHARAALPVFDPSSMILDVTHLTSTTSSSSQSIQQSIQQPHLPLHSSPSQHGLPRTPYPSSLTHSPNSGGSGHSSLSNGSGNGGTAVLGSERGSTAPLSFDGHSSIADQISFQLAQLDRTESTSFSSNHDLIDQSSQHSAERVVDVSPNKRYGRLNTLLGKGAFKVVHKAIDREEGYEVAWNVLQIGQENNKDIGHEIEILKSVRHPNIIAFHDAWLCESKTEFVFVTELMTSGTLREYIRKLSTPNPKVVKRWCRQILKGLAYLHGHNPPIIHRDIKCDNIFINGAHGEIKIGDLGTAENMWLGNKKYTVIGTPEFMAPEMYDERGYSEKVDIYAFGMCLLEMITSEYPYIECTNAAQVYRKVSQHIKPESLAKVQNPQVLEVINICLSTNESDRLSAQELLECSFLSVEPDLVLLATDPTHKILTLQVVFKGSDKVSVKFEFNVENDTAEDVVAEMVEEQVLPSQYRQWITTEINRILRDLDKDGQGEPSSNSADNQAVWRRENDIHKELERARQELEQRNERVAELERRCDMLKHNCLEAEDRYRDTAQRFEQFKSADTFDETEAEPSWPDDMSIDDFVRRAAVASNRSDGKAQQWARTLQAQDIIMVGDLRGLHDEDWSSIGLTVFALRALKNMLRHGRVSKITTDGALSDE